MSLLNLKIAVSCISHGVPISDLVRRAVLPFLAVQILNVTMAWGWQVDLSRRVRQDDVRKVQEVRWPSSLKSQEPLLQKDPIGGSILSLVEPTHSIAILNTEEGFVPDTIRIRRGGAYRVYVANLNKEAKNVSFMLDAFHIALGTYFYEKPSVFELKPSMDGIFTFFCPETKARGKIVVFSDSLLPPPAETSLGASGEPSR